MTIASSTASNAPRFRMRFVAIVIFFAALWLELWRQLSGEWSVNDQYSYGWFVPFFAIVLFWLRWEDRPQAREDRDHRSEVSDQRTNNRKQITNNAKARLVAIVALLLLFPIRLFEIGNPDWRPLSWLHAICVVTITLVFLWSIGGVPWLPPFSFSVFFVLAALPWIPSVASPV